VQTQEPKTKVSSWLKATVGVTPCFRKTNQVHIYMHARIKFHAYSRHK
jgi:hypothetical protein